MRICFVQPMLSMHQEALLNAVAAHREVSGTTIMVPAAAVNARINQGWAIPALDPNITLVEETGFWARIKFLKERRHDLFIFSGFGSSWQDYLILWIACIVLRSSPALYAEGIGSADPRVEIKRILYKIKRRLLPVRRMIVFAIGDKGKSFYTTVCRRNDAIIRACYYSGDAGVLGGRLKSGKDEGDGIKLIYVGRLIALKGIWEFIFVLERLVFEHNLNISMTIVGDGEQLPRLQKLVDRLRMTDHVSFMGTQTNATVKKIVQDHDLLVLPSIGDEGWGYVVNEALSCGVRVICSNNVGASCVVKENPEFGIVVDMGDRRKTAQEIWNFIADNWPLKNQILQSYKRVLSAKIGANLFIKAVSDNYER